MDDLLARIGERAIVPVVALDRVEDALPLGRAVLEGGLEVLELTLRTPAAEAAVRLLASELPDLVVGAGTVLAPEQAARAIDAGARFIVSPGFSARVVEACRARRVPVVPGTVTPTEIQVAREHGLDVVKFFPAETSGGPEALALLGAAFSGTKFLPTGGIDEGNLASYLSLGCVLACGGSWMTKSDRIRAGDFAGIASRIRRSVESARATRTRR